LEKLLNVVLKTDIVFFIIYYVYIYYWDGIFFITIAKSQFSNYLFKNLNEIILNDLFMQMGFFSLLLMSDLVLMCIFKCSYMQFSFTELLVRYVSFCIKYTS